MRLTLFTVAVAFLCVLPPAALASSKKGDPMSWKNSTIWSKYKAFWKEIPEAKSPTKLKALSEAAAGLSLTSVFLGSAELTTNLHASLSDRVEARSQILNRSFWKGDKPIGEKRFPYDPSEELARSVQMLVHDADALRGLRELKVMDPWVNEVLAPAVERGCQIVEAQLASGGDQAEARAAVGNARALLAESSAGH
jgi:hypothetical protein